MKTYSSTPPHLAGILSDDYLYFEGVSRPHSLSALCDGSAPGEDGKLLVLERYWNDLYNLFLRKLTLFASASPATDEETLKLQALLQELVKVKKLIENGGKADIMEG